MVSLRAPEVLGTVDVLRAREYRLRAGNARQIALAVALRRPFVVPQSATQVESVMLVATLIGVMDGASTGRACVVRTSGRAWVAKSVSPPLLGQGLRPADRSERFAPFPSQIALSVALGRSAPF